MTPLAIVLRRGVTWAIARFATDELVAEAPRGEHLTGAGRILDHLESPVDG